MAASDISILSRLDAVSGRLLLNALHKGDPDGFRHGYRVATMSHALSEIIQDESVSDQSIWLAGFFHDIGKLGIPDNILTAEGELTPHEMGYIQRHTTLGSFLLSRLMDSKEAAECALNHHERWDGTGYPNGLAGNNIPIVARIVAVADAYDAMRSAGWLFSHLDHNEVLNKLIDEGGKQFDPDIVHEFIEHSGRLEYTYDKMEEPNLQEILSIF